MLEVVELRREFRIRRGWLSHQRLAAVNGVSFFVERGRTVAVVGESGSGKSTLGRCVAGLLSPSSGQIRLDGVDLTALAPAAYRPYRRKLQMVFQDPDESLNPRLSAGATIGEPLRIWRGLRGARLREEVVRLLEQVQLDPALFRSHPHQLSGGQQQRVGIARALASNPEVVVLDEPTSALDVSVQAQILNLLVDLQQEYRVAYLLISHDLATVRYLAQDVVVLYLGQVVEQGPAEDIFRRPQHPYTRALLASAPRLHTPESSGRILLRGEAGNPLDVGPGCALAPRCPLALASCAITPQRLVAVAAGHHVACSVVTGVSPSP